MGGVLTHISAAALSAIIVHLIHFRLEFSIAVFLGNIVPDALKFGISGILNATVNLEKILGTKAYNLIAPLSDSAASWFSVGFFLFALSIFLYHHHVIRKRTMEEYDELYFFLLIGVVIHLLIDFFYIESSPWL